MKNSILVFILLIWFIAIKSGSAQYYLSGQDPASVKWNQIHTEYFQIIYPQGYDSVAQYVANVMEYGRQVTMKNRNVEPDKISVILHNQTIISNAEVAWAPRRMEFYTIGPQDSYSQEWFQQLAIHEYVHVLQLSSLRQGLGNFLYYLFGEQINVGLFGLYVPYWFVEGDAVVVETALSESGRGRDPNFEMELRAQLLEKGPYSLEKASLGSYKDFTTDRYHLGYYLVGQGKAGFGRDMWNKPLENVARYPLALVPFSTGIKTKTGMAKKKFYEWSLEKLDEKWEQQFEASKVDVVNDISQQKTYIDYTQINLLKSGEIISLKEDFHRIGELVQIDHQGNEKKIVTPGYYMKDRVSAGGDYICWVEVKYDPRWSYRKNTKLIIYHFQTGKKKTLVKKARYFSPQISADGSRILVVEVDEQNRNFLVVLNSESGEVMQRIQTPDQLSISQPSWHINNDKAVVGALGLSGKTIMVVDLQKEAFIQMLPWQNTQILNPRFWENYILFEASYNGVMNIYALDMATKSVFQTTNVAFGASDYQIDSKGQKIYFSNYTSNGKMLVSQKWNTKDWIPWEKIENHSYPLADILSYQEDTIFTSAYIPQKVYDISRYRKGLHLFNIHSWNFLNLDASNSSINPGISVLSQNKLNTLAARLGIDYSWNTQALRYYGQIDYLGWYPAFSLAADYGRQYADLIDNGDTTRHYWKETNLNASVYLPLLFTSGPWVHRMQPLAGFQYKQIDQGSDLDFNYRNLKTAVFALDYSAQYKSPFQNIYPRWGYNLSLALRQSILMEEEGQMLSAGISIYTPGFFRHDGMRLMLQYQDQTGAADFFTDWAGPARGYSNITYKDLMTFRADYAVPLFYPDWNLSSLLYIKRIKSTVFFDYTILPDIPAHHNPPLQSNFWSTGIDLTTDFHLLRAKFPFEIGLRSTYINGYSGNNQGLIFQLLWGVAI